MAALICYINSAISRSALEGQLSSLESIYDDLTDEIGKTAVGITKNGADGSVIFIFAQPTLCIYLQHIKLAGILIHPDIQTTISGTTDGNISIETQLFDGDHELFIRAMIIVEIAFAG